MRSETGEDCPRGICVDDQDFKRLEQLLTTVVDARFGQFKAEIKSEFRHQITIQTEDFQHGLQIVAEGYQMLSDKIDAVDKHLSGKIDAVAADLSAHRADTEAHHGVWRVKEESEK